MDKDACVDHTICRKLDFHSDEAEKEKEELNNSGSGEKLINERHSTISEDKIPKIGMEFESENEAYNFYNEYARLAGFGIRRHYVHTDNMGNIVDRIFCCACQGHREKDKRDVNVKSHRPETRTGCAAMMKIHCHRTAKYNVVDFIAHHNGHDLVSPTKTHLLRSHRRITVGQASQADDIEMSGITPKAGFHLMARQVGGRANVGFIFEDYKNYLRSKRTVEMKIGDTGGVLEYLQQRQLDDPNFFYAIQVDEDDLIANILWVDAQMMADYAYFGDVVCFDTTYRKNKEGRPFALFVGVNHHKQTVVFGAALLYDETASTFMWLFDTFARAMSGKKPQTILTDQDAAMAKALVTKWPETCHRLCIWHIYQNAAIHLSSVFTHFTNFSKDFSSCVYDFEEEEDFINAWQAMLVKYDNHTTEWSMNSVLKRYVSYKHNLLQFFHHFDRLVDERRYEELKADLRTSHSTPTASFPVEILKHAASVYTHEVFELFQNELRKAYDSRIELCNEVGDTFEYKVTPFRRHYQHTVLFELSQVKVSCSCRKFEFAGILCSHALKVLSSRNIVEIPELYIKKRWTKKAKKKIIDEAQPFGASVPSEPMNEKDEKKKIAAQYKDLCGLHNQLVTRAALTEETFRIAKGGLLKLIEEVDASLENRTLVRPTLGPKSVVQQNLVSYNTEDALNGVGNASNDIVIRGWKNKEKKPTKSGKRPRSGLEKSTQKKKKKQKHNNVSPSNSAIEHGITINSSQMRNPDNNTNGLSMDAPIESLPLPSLSQLSQVVMSNSSVVYPTEGSSLAHVEPFKFGQIFKPIVYQQHSITPPYSRQDHQSEMSLTELLQQQLIKPQGFERLPLNNIAPQG
ncbi:hypothetical protein BUALT_Bualt18G0069900 [Buddleja alternifolia]|uniref:Protein FAR1-RELATED SEQUENCE n=1 Tax=Buddleja alternifolia TaxID=168488 RepID=A0AAV6W9H1_9LAMI|nr:hypothetical protein BUALT_Bualt18G0069900 [Buddleja alternifolia]